MFFKRFAALLILCSIPCLLALMGCGGDVDPPYPGQEFTFAGDYVVLGFGFEESGQYFQQRSLVNVAEGSIEGNDLLKVGHGSMVSGQVSAAYTVEQTGELEVFPDKRSQRTLSAAAPLPSFGAKPFVELQSKLLGGPSLLQGYVHQPEGSVAYVGDFESLDFQECQIFLEREAEAHSNESFAGRWAIATMYEYDGQYYTLTGFMDATPDGGVEYFFEYFYNSEDPTNPSTFSTTRDPGHWNVQANGYMSYGDIYDGYICGNREVFFWDSIEAPNSDDPLSPAVGVLMDEGGYHYSNLSGSYIISGVESNSSSGARSCLGGLIEFDELQGSPYFHLVATRNVRGEEANREVDQEGFYTLSEEGELRLYKYSGQELLRGYVGCRSEADGLSRRAVAAPLKTPDTFGMYFIGR